MIVNRYILRKMGLSEKIIDRMQLVQKITPYKFRIAMFNKMMISDRGYFVSTPHFDITEWIKMQRHRLEVAHPRHKKSNKILLDTVVSAFKQYRKREAIYEADESR